MKTCDREIAVSSSYETIKQGWYLVKAKPGEELRAVENLENQEFEAYCPVYLESGRNTVLFPGYVFVYLCSKDLERYHKIRSTRGVARIVTFNQMYRKSFERGHIKSPTQDDLQKLLPQPMPNGEQIIHQIKEIIWTLNGNKPEEKPKSSQFKEGEQVRINNVLFQHLQSTFIRGINVDRGLVLIEFIKSQRVGDEVIKEQVTRKEIEVSIGELEKV